MPFVFDYQQASFQGLDAIKAVSIIDGGYFEHRLLSFDSDSLKHVRLSLGDTKLESGSHNFPIIARGKVAPNTIYIGFMSVGAESTRYNGIPVEAGRMRIYPEGTEVLYQATGAAQWFTYSISRQTLQTVLDQYSAGLFQLSTDQIITLHITPAVLEQLKQEVADVLVMAEKLSQFRDTATSSVAKMLSDNLMSAYVKAICAPQNIIEDAKSLSLNRFHGQLVMGSEHLALMNMEQHVKLTELADFTGYSLRAMELIFKKTVGMTPTRWFINIRLNGALRDLMQGTESTSVSEVANRWGFQHLARFSEQYRKAFGELPSKTLARARKNTQQIAD